MKTLLKIVFVGIPVLVIGLAVALYFLFNPIVKRGVEVGGTALTQTDVRLDESKVSPFSGVGELKGLSVGNPEGFSKVDSFRMKSVRVSLATSTIMSEKLVVREVVVDSPEITCEFRGKENNLKKILDNVKSRIPDELKKKRKKKKNIQIDSFVMKNAKVHIMSSLLQGKKATFSIGDIHLKDIGKDGKTTGEAIGEILGKINRSVLKTWRGSAWKVKSKVRNGVNKLKNLFE